MAGADAEADVPQDVPAAQPDAQAVDREHVRRAVERGRGCRGEGHSFSVDTFWVMALMSARTSASIQDW